jgi:hypothetical protein
MFPLDLVRLYQLGNNPELKCFHHCAIGECLISLFPELSMESYEVFSRKVILHLGMGKSVRNIGRPENRCFGGFNIGRLPCQLLTASIEKGRF